jgi:Bacterial antitoxin of type II TA system, VapB
VKGEFQMSTNLALDDSLILEAQKVGGHITKKAAVSQALMEYILRRRQLEVVELFGSVDYDQEYDYKQQRRVSACCDDRGDSTGNSFRHP